MLSMNAEGKAGGTDGREPYRRVLDELLGGPAGTAVRVAFVYEDDAIDIAHLREDLLSVDMRPRVEELHERATHFQMAPDETTRTVYGDLELVVAVREEVVELYFLGGEGEGLIATADRSADVLVELLQL